MYDGDRLPLYLLYLLLRSVSRELGGAHHVSADDHVDLSHDHVKKFLSSKFHGDYDEAVAEFARSMGSTISAEANQRWREQQGLEVDLTAMPMIGKRQYAASGRAGHTDPIERLKDMDTDGVDASSSYCEVSAFRYLYMVEERLAGSYPGLEYRLGRIPPQLIQSD